MRPCPFCGFDEGWTQDLRDKFSDEPRYRVECKVCKSVGPSSQTREGAERKWDGYLKEIDPSDKGAMEWGLEENVGAPMTTMGNVPGMGNVVPGGSTGMGSGDKFDNSMGPYTQDGKVKKKKKRVYKKKKKANEGASINPYDEIGKSMAKQMGVPLYFEKGKDQSVKHVKQKDVENMKPTSGQYTYKVATLDDFKKKKKKK